MGIRERYNPAMRRFGRWMFNGLTVLSLVLCVGACVMWVRSYSTATEATRIRWQRSTTFASTRGWLWILCYTNRSEKLNSPTQWFVHERTAWVFEPPLPYGDAELRVYGMTWCADHSGDGSWETNVRWPWLVLLFGTAPTIWMLRYARRRLRVRPGCCASCRYDLTGNISGVCPECGKPISVNP
jgi:hypothetical protein